jgi:hypothetical protein
MTITSPYSAALSVPMHLYQGSGNYSGEGVKVVPATVVPIARGFGLPVWAIFLIMYPPLCAVLFGVTYLAFRIRWWKAGGT